MTNLLPIVPGCRALFMGKVESIEVTCVRRLADDEAAAVLNKSNYLYHTKLRDENKGKMWLLDRNVKYMVVHGARRLNDCLVPMAPEHFLMRIDGAVEETQDEKEAAPVEGA